MKEIDLKSVVIGILITILFISTAANEPNNSRNVIKANEIILIDSTGFPLGTWDSDGLSINSGGLTVFKGLTTIFDDVFFSNDFYCDTLNASDIETESIFSKISYSETFINVTEDFQSRGYWGEGINPNISVFKLYFPDDSIPGNKGLSIFSSPTFGTWMTIDDRYGNNWFKVYKDDRLGVLDIKNAKIRGLRPNNDLEFALSTDEQGDSFLILANKYGELGKAIRASQ